MRENQQNIINEINHNKDVDGNTDQNLARLAVNSENPFFVPCTPAACFQILSEYNIPVEGKNCLLVNRSRVVGVPLLHLLMQKNAAVSVVHSQTKTLKEMVELSDIIFTATGKYGIINSEWIKPDTVVIDIATTFIKHEGKDKLVGDIVFHEVMLYFNVFIA